jgi:hypothetical protein
VVIVTSVEFVIGIIVEHQSSFASAIMR